MPKNDPPPSQKSVQICSVHEFIAFVTDTLDESWIFRGQENSSWELVPAIDRITHQKIARRIFEAGLLEEFARRARPFLSREPTNRWEWLALAQHHGLPTRMLDWTTNPLVGLHFAVENPACNSDSTVWCLKGVHEPFRTVTEDPFDIATVVVYTPPHITPRIVPQSGVFSVHPPLIDLGIHPAQPVWAGALLAITIPSRYRDPIRDMLTRMGIHAASLFPDVDGIAKYLGRHWLPPEGERGIKWRAKGHDLFQRWVRSKENESIGTITECYINRETGHVDRAKVDWRYNNRGGAVPIEESSSVVILSSLEILEGPYLTFP